MSLPTAGYFILHQNSVQQYLVQKVSEKLSGIFGTSVSVNSVYIDILSNIKLKGLCVMDLHNDTLLYAPEFIVRPNSFTITSRFVELDRVVLLPHMGSATIEGRVDMGEKVIINIKTFVDGHKPPDRVLAAML